MKLNVTIATMIKALSYSDRIKFMILYKDELDGMVNGNEENVMVLLNALNNWNEEVSREKRGVRDIYHF